MKKSNSHSGNKITSSKATSKRLPEKEIVELVYQVKKLVASNEKILKKLEQRENNACNSEGNTETFCSLGWKGNNEQLNALHSGLLKIGFIKVSYKEMTKCFTGKHRSCKKIQWNSSESKLVFLMEALSSQGLIKFDNARFKTISKHFINCKGKAYKPRQLSSVNEQNKDKKEKHFSQITKLLSDLQGIEYKKTLMY